MQAAWILVMVLAVALRSTSANTIVLDRSLLDAMREVESSGNVCAIGDNGLSLGPYQIMTSYYNDASDPELGDPTLTDNDQTYTDVWGQGSSAYAEDVIQAYMCRYATEARLGRPPSNEDIARIHNGGPDGFDDPTTVPYWNSVRAAIERIAMGGTAAPPVAGSPSQCDPPCEDGQCCQQDNRGRYRCFCVELVEGSTTTHRRVPCADCLIAGLDLVFVVDASGSIGPTNFDLIRDFITTIVMSLDIGSDASQVGVIRFASDASVIFNLDTHDNQADLLTAVSNIIYTGGGTNTAAALDLLLSDGFTGARPEVEGVPRVAIVVTDGISNNAAATLAAAAAIHAADPVITVFAAGIGAGTNPVELEAIASSPSDRFVTTISGFNTDELATLAEDLQLEACQAAMVSVVGGPTIERMIRENLKAFFEYTIPVEGFTIAITVEEGGVSICGSTTIERPCCSVSTLYDWIRDVDGFDDIFLTMEGNDADNLPPTVGAHRRQVIMSNNTNTTMFVTIEGLGENNTFAFNTTFGDTRVARGIIVPVPVDDGLTFIDDSPRISQNNNTGKWDLWANFTSGINGARYICILKRRTPPRTRVRVRCDDFSVHFTDLVPGSRYILKIKCKVGRQTEAAIRRKIMIPADPEV